MRDGRFGALSQHAQRRRLLLLADVTDEARAALRANKGVISASVADAQRFEP